MSSAYDEYQRQIYEAQRRQMYEMQRLAGSYPQMTQQQALAKPAPAKPKEEMDRSSQLLLLEDVK